MTTTLEILMELKSLMLVEPPDISDESAAEMLDFLYELINAFENSYRQQLLRYQRQPDDTQPDLFDGLDDNLPSF